MIQWWDEQMLMMSGIPDPHPLLQLVSMTMCSTSFLLSGISQVSCGLHNKRMVTILLERESTMVPTSPTLSRQPLEILDSE